MMPQVNGDTSASSMVAMLNCNPGVGERETAASHQERHLRRERGLQPLVDEDGIAQTAAAALAGVLEFWD